MPGPLPGTPPIVLHARAIARRDVRARVRNGVIGLVLAVALAVGVGLAGADPQLALIAAVPTLPIVGLLTSPIPNSEREDARLILAGWEARRKAWATEMLDASVRGASDDVQTWSAAAKALTKLREGG